MPIYTFGTCLGFNQHKNPHDQATIREMTAVGSLGCSSCPSNWPFKQGGHSKLWPSGSCHTTEVHYECITFLEWGFLWDVLLWRRTEWARLLTAQGNQILKRRIPSIAFRKQPWQPREIKIPQPLPQRDSVQPVTYLAPYQGFTWLEAQRVPCLPLPVPSSPFQSLNISHVQITTQVNHDASIIKLMISATYVSPCIWQNSAGAEVMVTWLQHSTKRAHWTEDVHYRRGRDRDLD